MGDKIEREWIEREARGRRVGGDEWRRKWEVGEGREGRAE